MPAGGRRPRGWQPCTRPPSSSTSRGTSNRRQDGRSACDSGACSPTLTCWETQVPWLEKTEVLAYLVPSAQSSNALGSLML